MLGNVQTLLMYLVGSVPGPPSPAPLLGVRSLDFDPILDTAGLTAAGNFPSSASLSPLAYHHSPPWPPCGREPRHGSCGPC